MPTSSCLRRPHTAGNKHLCYSSAVPLESPCRPLNDSRIRELVGIEIYRRCRRCLQLAHHFHQKKPLPLSGLYFMSYDRPQEPTTDSQHLSGETAGQGPWSAAEGVLCHALQGAELV